MIPDPEKPKIEGGELNSPTLSENGKIFPGKTIYKDPTITNVGDDDAWVCAKVIIEDGSKDIHKLFGYEGYNEIDVEGLLSGGLLDETVTVGAWNGIEDVCYNDHYAMVQVADRANDKFEFYFFILTEMKNGDAVTVFEEIFFDPIFDHSQMLELSELLGDCHHPLLIGKSERVYGNSRAEVYIFLSVRVTHHTSLSRGYTHGKARVGRSDVLLVLLYCVHICTVFLLV